LKTLIVPDIHLQWPVADAIISLVKADRVVLLGDYFHNWNDTPEENAEMARWVKKNIDNYTFLLGNHDAAHFYSISCSGWTKAKDEVIKDILPQEYWGQFKFFESIDGWLLTHAGLTKQWVPESLEPKDVISWLEDEVKYAVKTPFNSWVFAVGRMRCGAAPQGGILWTDRREFIPIPGVKQIFGHMHLTEPVWFNEHNVGIDTNLSHCTILEDGRLEVKETRKLS